MSKRLLTKESVLKALEASKATSISSLYRAMGGGASIPGSTAKRIRELVPDVGERLKSNKGGDAKTVKPSTGKAKSFARSAPYPRHPTNPFRDGCGYSLCFSILAAHPDGLSRQRLLDLYAKASGKDENHARFDLAVVLSPRESATGPRHRSCREGYHVEVVNDHVRLIVPDGKGV